MNSKLDARQQIRNDIDGDSLLRNDSSVSLSR